MTQEITIKYGLNIPARKGPGRSDRVPVLVKDLYRRQHLMHPINGYIANLTMHLKCLIPTVDTASEKEHPTDAPPAPLPRRPPAVIHEDTYKQPLLVAKDESDFPTPPPQHQSLLFAELAD